MIRNAVLHINNEQPLLADLFALPAPSDVAILCTNLRLMNGSRPVFVDAIDSTFLFPLIHIRFVEIMASSMAASLGTAQPVPAQGDAPSPEVAEPESDLEIDEDLLRRIREA